MRHPFTFLRRPALSAVPAPPANSFPLLAGVCLGVLLGWWLYAGTLSVPFLQEDVTHIRWLSRHTVLEPFVTAEGAPDYRPLGKSIIKFWYEVLGEHDRVWLRFNNLVLNSLNIALVGLLGSWLDRGRSRAITGGTAALLFGTFPFAYQAVPWINNFFYPLVNFLLLMMTAVYWQARVRRSNRLLILALALCFLAPFEIEYGLMGGGLLFAVELALWLQGRQRRMWLGGPLLGLLMNSAFLVRSLTIPKEDYFFGLPTAERLMQIGVYLLQGLTYPLAPAALALKEATGLNDLSSIALVGLPLLGLTAVFLLRRGQRALLAFAGLWFVLLNGPTLVFLNFNYVVNSPRLLYPPGGGVTWLWGALFAGLAGAPGVARHKKRFLGPLLAGSLVAVVVLQSMTFVERRMRQYHMAEAPILAVTELARAAPPENRLLIVNLPSWMTPAEPTFALGNHGIQLIPFYISIEDVVYAHNDADHPTTAVQFTNIRQEQPYYYGMLGPQRDYEGIRADLLAAGDVFVVEYGADAIALKPAGRATAVPLGEPVAVFGDAIALQPVAVEWDDDAVELTLNWRLLRSPGDADLTVFVHLYGQDGRLLAQADGDPLRGLAPFWLWEAGQTLQDRRTLPLPPDLPAGDYRLGVGVYDRASGQRLTAVGPDGERLLDDAFVIRP